jgi:membrane protein implicated in regulation of membrane protease activity
MSNSGLSRLPRVLRLGVVGIVLFIAWTAIKWTVRIYMIVWLESLGVPPGVSWIIAFGTVAAILFAAAYFLKPWFDRLMKDDSEKDS